jgi:hypothetical protein
MAFSDTLSRCIDSWQAEGIKLGQPLVGNVIRQTWSSLGQRLSRDVLTLYSTLSGFAEYEADEEFFWSLWPWDWLKERNQAVRRTGVMFCDHSIEICNWELRYENEEVSSVWLVQDAEQTAPSLEAFFDLYLDDPWKLL